MKRHHLIVMAMVLVLAVSAGTSVGSATAQTIDLKFAHFMSPKHVQHRMSFDPFCKKVEELSGGQVKIKLFPGGALGGPKQLPDSVQSGVTDIAFIIPPYTTGRFPHISVIDLPFLCDSAVHGTKVIYALWDNYISKDFKDYKVLWLYCAGTGQFMSVEKPMKMVKDIKGLKMRAPTAYMSKAFKLLGANPIGMPISKLTVSLQKKVIDGMLTPYSAVQDFRLYDLLGHITEANVYVTPMAVVMNKDKWNSLPDAAKAAIDKASGMQWGLHAATVYDEYDQTTLQEIKKRGKIQVYVMPGDEKQTLESKVSALTDEWLAEMTKKGLAAKELLDAANTAIEKTR